MAFTITHCGYCFDRDSQVCDVEDCACHKFQEEKSRVLREDARKLLGAYHDYLMDEFNGNASEEAIEMFLDTKYVKEQNA